MGRQERPPNVRLIERVDGGDESREGVHFAERLPELCPFDEVVPRVVERWIAEIR